ncbi:MAG TPA: N-acetylmuramoyl-L-alanine amidase [Terriglobales bacterium]|nr:N-acetylmuramoyl-L-alanine amidase [Terriglobales bacterium]
MAVPCAQAKRTLAQKKLLAQAQFETAEKMREALNGRPENERTRRDYDRVTEAFRKVYLICANFRKADESIVDTAELLAETGRAFHDPKASQDAIAQYQFLMQQYPGSVHNSAAMFTIGKIYQEDLEQNDKAKDAFEEFLKRHPQHRLSDDARQALDDIAHPQAAKAKAAKARKKAQQAQHETAAATRGASEGGVLRGPQKEERDAQAARESQNAKLQQVEADSHPDDTARNGRLPLVTGIRHWSTPDYTRVAIDLEDEVKYEAGRIPSPDRVFFDLADTKLAPELIGKTFEIDDGFLRKIRVAQYQRGVTRVVLEVDPVSEYSAFLLPNPYRLIIDIHGKAQAQTSVAYNSTPPRWTDAGDAATLAGKTANTSSATSSSPQPTTAAKNAPLDTATADPTPITVKPGTPKPAATVPPPVVPAHSSVKLSALFPPPNASSAIQRVQKPASIAAKATEENAKPGAENKAIADKSAAKNSANDTARNDPATSLAMGKSGEAEVKATSKPTSAPTFQEVVPRSQRDADAEDGREQRDDDAATPTLAQGLRSVHKKASDKDLEAATREAQPASDGQRSLIRALGLKIGRIVVDAGHGGHDTGTVGPNGLQEKDLVLDVALRLGKLLQKKMGAEVVYTRSDDTFVPLETRTAIANQEQADLFISVHANSSHDPTARGVETYYLNFTSSADALEVAARENAVSEKSIHELQDLVKKIALKEKIEESREFASDVQSALSTGLSTKNSKMRNRGVKKAPFIVLIGANMPSILAEISFVSNPADEHKLQTAEYRQKIADSLYHGVAKYVSGLSGVKLALNRSGE